MPIIQRNALREIALLIDKEKEALAYLESTTGKPIRQARGDIQATIDCFHFFSGKLFL